MVNSKYECQLCHRRPRSKNPTRPESRDEIIEFAKRWKTKRCQSPYSLLSEQLTEADAVGMTNFYFSVMRRLVRIYSRWAQPTHRSLDYNKAVHDFYFDIYLYGVSRSEEIRMLRALYRFQLSCNLFGATHEWSRDREMPHWDDRDIRELFFDNFEPWEVEEWMCIYFFLEHGYIRTFGMPYPRDKLMYPWAGARQPFEEHHPYPYNCINTWRRWSYIEPRLRGLVTRGLELFYYARIWDGRRRIQHDCFVDMGNEVHLGPSKIVPSIGHLPIHPALEPSERSLKQERRDPLPFQGDKESRQAGDDSQYPPFAWTVLWGGTYSNMYGWTWMPHRLHRWGYVMWDADRIRQRGAQDALRQQWETAWQGRDPRDLPLNWVPEHLRV
ncbi:hypothetical protein QBC46DRAFT_435200 [Diplogelasinospora grovesii]|uniref:Uncharacterized protein n=1 Tax=Diplogelasinospora grovesii TaxID=303347 RepID=A0AAN6N6P6_9PEZI|nr:hypothetical protein QBC46DRAFT_435200 [Diplogelasinospora grovesii]